MSRTPGPAGRGSPARPALIAFCIAWYCGTVLFWSHSPVQHRAGGLTLTFNSMMDHMIRGRFDVDPGTVGQEGFLRDGRVYAYWGFVPALLRLPLLLVPGGSHLDVTRLSCAVSATLVFLVNYRSWLFLDRRVLAEHAPWLRGCLFLAVAFSGVQICFLRSSLFQEVCLWSLVFAMLFVHWAVRFCLDRTETGRALVWMSASAGLALATRVSMGVGLYSALALLCLVALRRTLRRPRAVAMVRRVSPRALLAAAAVTVLSLSAVMLVNQERWGDPFTFADYRLYLLNAEYPDRLPRAEHYGLFNPRRLPLGLVYFFFPVWVFHGAGGRLLLQQPFARLVDAVELPPSSFFLTDGFLLLLCGSFAVASARSARSAAAARLDRPAAIAIAAGLCAAPLLMLMAISMNFRYRAEFYPPMLFAAFMGAAANARALSGGTARRLGTALLIVGILASHVVLAFYALSDFGPSRPLLDHGIVAYYERRIGL